MVLGAKYADPAWRAAQDAKAAAGARLFEADANRQKRLHVENVMATVGKRYQGCDLDTFEVSGDPKAVQAQRRVLERLRAFCAGVKAETEAGRGLLLFGAAGTGKDHLMVAALRYAAAAQIAARWVSGVELYATWRDEIDNEANEHSAIQRYVKPTILAISDPQPPAGTLTEHQAAKLFWLVDSRYRAGKATWATINAANFEDAAKKVTVPIADRLRDGALALACNWPSHRRSH